MTVTVIKMNVTAEQPLKHELEAHFQNSSLKKVQGLSSSYLSPRHPGNCASPVWRDISELFEI